MKRDNNSTLFWWLSLMLLSVAFSGILLVLKVPAGMMLGPLLAGIIVVMRGGTIQIAPLAFELSQGLIGCMIAGMLPGFSIQSGNKNNWELMLVGVGGVVAASGVLSWIMTRLQILPGSTAVWGLSPGAATAMTVMAESSGADPQLVALMQYLRVVLVAVISSSILRIFAIGHTASTLSFNWFAPAPYQSVLETIALAVIGSLAARRVPISAGALMIPLVAGILLSHHGLISIALPRWLIAAAYMVFGWRIGLRFTKELLQHAIRLLPRVIACTLLLIFVCMMLGLSLVRIGHIDPLSAYLATSPGGADAVAIIAASSKVDIHFVMTMQMLRVITTLVLARFMTRFITANIKSASGVGDATTRL